MIPLVITFVVALLVFAPAFIRAYSLSKLSRLAAKEFRMLHLQINLIDTMAEYDFWRHEVQTFLTFYRGKIPPRLYIMYEVILASAFKMRLEKGFTKALVTDKL
jgi:hypothetical protein